MKQYLKTFLFATCVMLMAMTVSAQDKMCKMTGQIIDVKVTRVDNKLILYNNPDGHEHWILKKKVAYIVYQNGITDVFQSLDTTVAIKEPRHAHQSNLARDSIRRAARLNSRLNDRINNIYGKTIISLTSAYSQSSDHTINDPGMGLAYERFIGRNRFISINIPVMVCLSTVKDYSNSIVQSNNGQYYPNGSPVNYAGTYSAVYFTPGIKFYLVRSNRKVRYSIGASFLAIMGGEPYGVRYDAYSSNNSFAATYHYGMYGLMLSNSLNIMAAKHLLIAIDLGVGIPESDNRYINDNTSNPETVLSPFIQWGFKLGYRY